MDKELQRLHIMHLYVDILKSGWYVDNCYREGDRVHIRLKHRGLPDSNLISMVLDPVIH